MDDKKYIIWWVLIPIIIILLWVLIGKSMSTPTYNDMPAGAFDSPEGLY